MCLSKASQSSSRAGVTLNQEVSASNVSSQAALQTNARLRRSFASSAARPVTGLPVAQRLGLGRRLPRFIAHVTTWLSPVEPQGMKKHKANKFPRALRSQAHLLMVTILHLQQIVIIILIMIIILQRRLHTPPLGTRQQYLVIVMDLYDHTQRGHCHKKCRLT